MLLFLLGVVVGAVTTAGVLLYLAKRKVKQVKTQINAVLGTEDAGELANLMESMTYELKQMTGER